MTQVLQQRELGPRGQAIKGAAVSFGTMSLYSGPGTLSEAQSIDLVRHSLARGINILNTSAMYGKNGENEIMLGKALQGIPRKEVVVVTKWGPYWGPQGLLVDASAAKCRRVIDEQLERLQTSFIDVWVFRGTDPRVSIEETVSAMKEAVLAGKVKHIGLSECTADEIRRAHAIHPITLLEQEWSLFTRDIEVDLLPTASELGIGILAYGPLGHGALTDSLRTLADIPANDFRRHFPRFSEETFPQNRLLVDKLGAVAKEKGCTTGQLAIAWLLHASPNVIPLFGTKSQANFEANIAAVDVSLTPADLEAIAGCFSSSQVAGDRSIPMAMPYYLRAKA